MSLQTLDILLWAFWECMGVICVAWWINDRLTEYQAYLHEMMMDEIR